jgi:spermidine/putrescine transport system substrate-binding protein
MAFRQLTAEMPSCTFGSPKQNAAYPNKIDMEHLMSDSVQPARTFNRRQALGFGLAAAGGMAFLAACSSDSTTPTTQPTAIQANTGKITILTWETYHDTPWLDAYKAQTGVQVEAITVGSGDELFAKAQSGTVKPDLLYFDSGLIPRFVKANLIAPVVLDRLKNTALITPGLNWQTNNTYDNLLYGVPYNWGNQPLMYNAGVITTPPNSWGALWDPAYKGKVVMFDAADVTIPMVALYVGAKDPYHLTDEEFDKVRDALQKLRPQVRTIAKGFDDAVSIFAAGDGVIGYCQNISEVAQLNKDGKNFAYTFPKEGTPSWQDNAAITGAGQRQEVYDFIDANTTVPWQARFIEASSNNGILSADEARKGGVPDDVLKLTNILDAQDPAFWSKMRPLQDPESISMRLEVWNEFKAGA